MVSCHGNVDVTWDEECQPSTSHTIFYKLSIQLNDLHLIQNGFLQALLSGCSAGGLASILHCDKFRYLFPKATKVKCLSDAGMFLNA